jgi:hypothetical protein
VLRFGGKGDMDLLIEESAPVGGTASSAPTQDCVGCQGCQQGRAE